MRIKLMLVNRNENFAANFSNYINNQYRMNFSVAVYTNLDALVSQQMRGIDMAVIESDYYNEVKDVIDLKGMIVVLLHNGNLLPEFQDKHNISMFEESDKIIQFFLDVYQKEKQVMLQTSAEVTRKVIGFFSPIGGSGKTSLSLVTANLLARKGHRVLYMSLDHFMDMDVYYKGEAKEDLTFLFTTFDDKTDIRRDISEIVCKDSLMSNLHYVKSFAQFSDRLEVNPSLWDMFCDKLIQLPDYDFIVLDLPTDMDRKAQTLLNSVDYLMLVTGKTTVERLKFEAFKKYMRKLTFFNSLERDDQVYLLYNNSRNVDWNREVSDEGFIKVEIDFDKAFKQYSQEKNLITLKTDTDMGLQLSTIVDNILGQIDQLTEAE